MSLAGDVSSVLGWGRSTSFALTPFYIEDLRNERNAHIDLALIAVASTWVAEITND